MGLKEYLIDKAVDKAEELVEYAALSAAVKAGEAIGNGIESATEALQEPTKAIGKGIKATGKAVGKGISTASKTVEKGIDKLHENETVDALLSNGTLAKVIISKAKDDNEYIVTDSKGISIYKAEKKKLTLKTTVQLYDSHGAKIGFIEKANDVLSDNDLKGKIYKVVLHGRVLGNVGYYDDKHDCTFFNGKEIYHFKKDSNGTRCELYLNDALIFNVHKAYIKKKESEYAKQYVMEYTDNRVHELLLAFFAFLLLKHSY